MAPEVISLVSSPDIGPSRATRQPSSPLGSERRHGAREISTRFSLDDDLDIATFDLTADPREYSHPPRVRSNVRSTDPISLLSEDDPPSPQIRRKSSIDIEDDAPTPKRRRQNCQAVGAFRSETFQSWSFSRLNSAESAHSGAGSRPDSVDVNNNPCVSSPPQPIAARRTPSWAKPTNASTTDDIDFIASSPPVSRFYSGQELPRKAVAWDPISSSAPLHDNGRDTRQAQQLRRTQSDVITLDSDSSAASDVEEDPKYGDVDVDNDDDDDLPDLATMDPAKLRAMKTQSKPPPRLPLKSQSSKTSDKPKAPALKKTTAEREGDKAQKAAAREAEKRRKLKEKEWQREEKAMAKRRAAALAEVNKIRTDKKISTPEMIVDLPANLDPTIKMQAETLLEDLDVEACDWTSPVQNVVKWRRKVKSRYNEELEHWEPIPPRIDPETYAMVLMPAARFVKLALGEEGETLESHVLAMRTHFNDHNIIYLLEGMTPWLRRNRNLRNRQFVSAVRSGLGEEPSDSQQPSGSQVTRRRKPAAAPQQYIDEDAIEDALLQLQVLHGMLIHHTNAPVESAQWIATFTQHISTVPYRRQREDMNAASAGFCMETGQVRTGDGPKDTYLRILQEIGRITAPIAYGIASEFESVSRLVKGLEEGGPLTLEGVRKSANKDGAYSDRAVGQAVSRRVYKIFTGRDETSTEI